MIMLHDSCKALHFSHNADHYFKYLKKHKKKADKHTCSSTPSSPNGSPRTTYILTSLLM